MQPHFRAFADSPFADLSEGYEAFARDRSKSGSDLVKSVAQKARKMEREVAPMRFEAHVLDRQALALLYEWKAAQRARTNTVDVLSTPWMREIVGRLIENNRHVWWPALCPLCRGSSGSRALRHAQRDRSVRLTLIPRTRRTRRSSSASASGFAESRHTTRDLE